MIPRSFTIAFTALALLSLRAPAADPPKAPAPDDQYVLGPDSKPKEGVPRGVLTKYSLTDCKTFPGTVRDYWIYVPAEYDGKTPACLFVCQDGVQYNAPTVFDNLIAARQMPVTIGLFINPGSFPPNNGEPAKDAKGRPARSNRSFEYDSLGDTYASFIIDEMMPPLAARYSISAKPEDHCIAGASSGGICAFNVAFERPDQFRKVFTSIGSFTNIRGGGVYPDLVRKGPKLPLRVYQQDGSNDIVNRFGSWPEANKAMNAALEERGYDHKFTVGQGTHNPRHAASIFPDVMRWMWRE